MACERRSQLLQAAFEARRGRLAPSPESTSRSAGLARAHALGNAATGSWPRGAEGFPIVQMVLDVLERTAILLNEGRCDDEGSSVAKVGSRKTSILSFDLARALRRHKPPRAADAD